MAIKGRKIAGNKPKKAPKKATTKTPTAAGGTRSVGGGLAIIPKAASRPDPNPRTDFSTFNRAGRMRGKGVFRDGVKNIKRTLVTAPGAPGGTGGLVKTSNDPYRGASGLAVYRQGGKRASARVKGNAGGRTVNAAGKRTDSRKANAIRELIKRGGTPGEKAAAKAAADRMGIKY